MSKIELKAREFENLLVENFPKLYRDMRGDPSKTCMAWGCSVSNGWYDIIWELSEKVEPLIGDTDICAAQVKEKFGTLRFYVNDYSNEEINQLVQEAETKTNDTCEICGLEGSRRSGGWIVTLCDKHHDEHGEDDD